MMDRVLADLEQEARRLVGLPTWGGSVGHGSLLIIEFGEVRTSSTGGRRGEFYLWIYGAPWTIREHGVPIANSEQTHRAMAAGAARLDGRSVRQLVVDPETLALRLRLSGDVELAVPALVEPDMDEWLLYLDDGDVVTAGPNGSLIRESSSRPVSRDPADDA